MSDASYIINEDESIPETDNIDESEGTEVEESTIPKQFQGKSMEEIIDSYTNLEKEHSRQGNELGENRKLVDRLLQAENQQTEVNVEEADWDYEPEKATKNLIGREVGELKTELQQIKSETALEKFKAQYPDFDKDSNSPEFMEWVQGSDYRRNLFNKNVNGVDLSAAGELMSGWEDRKSLLSQDKPSTEKRDKDLKAASMERSASSGGSRKKTWSRAYIRDLRLNHPEKYLEHKDAIMQAYDENRVTK